MHCDWLTVTMNSEPHAACCEELIPLIAQLGMFRLINDTYHFSDGGSLSMRSNYGVSTISASGGVLELLRHHGLWGAYLGVLADYPLNVSRLDVAHDVDTPTVDGASREVLRLDRKARSGDVVFLRRKLKPSMKRLLLETDQHGNETGTLYIGPKKPQVAQIRVYDKAHQVKKFKGIDIPPRIRYEVQGGRKAGCTLRDAWEPDAFFWAHIGNLLPHPPDVPDWEPNRDLVQFDKNVPSLPAVTLKRLLESSDFVSRVALLSAQIGPGGLTVARRLFEARLQAELSNLSDSEETAVRADSGGSN